MGAPYLMKLLWVKTFATFLPLSIVLRESSEISANLELQRIPQYFMASKSLDIWLFRPAESRDCCRRRMNANVVFAWYNHVLSGMENPDPENNMPSSKNVHGLGLSTKVSYEISCRRSATGYVSRIQCHTLKTHHPTARGYDMLWKDASSAARFREQIPPSQYPRLNTSAYGFYNSTVPKNLDVVNTLFLSSEVFSKCFLFINEKGDTDKNS